MEVIGRVESGTETESNAGAVAEDVMYVAGAWARIVPQGQASRFQTILLHFLHPCRSCTGATNYRM